jgi:hypothetical protein
MVAFVNRRMNQMGSISAEKKELLKRTIEQKVADLMAMIDDSSVVRNAQQLRDTEKSIAAVTDAIAGSVVEAVVARSVHDESLIAEAKTLVSQSPIRMKKRGIRPVEIQPYRGSPFTIEATYYAKAGQSAKRADKKGGSTQS